ncbi:hypothetical protein D3C76_1298680 [compost metagenome]
MSEKKGKNAPEVSGMGFMGEKKGINTPEVSELGSVSEKKGINPPLSSLKFTVKPIPFPYYPHILKQNHDMEMTVCPRP